MNNMVKINVVEVVGDGICVTDGDGKKVYDEIFYFFSRLGGKLLSRNLNKDYI